MNSQSYKKVLNKILDSCQKGFILWISVIVTLLGIGITFWFIYRGVIYDQYINSEWGVSLEKSSQFGDFIGGCVGTLFALVGVFLLFETLKLQRIELKESRYIFKLQQFDSLFFNSLNLYNTILTSISDNTGNNKGRKFFENEMNHILADPNIDSSGKTKARYLQFYSTYEPQVAHYFRTIYQIFNQIAHSSINEEDRVKYAKIIRAQLSLGELFFLYYNGRTVYGTKFRKYINDYNLLKHLSIVDMPEFRGFFATLNDIEKHTCKVAFLEITKGIKKSLNNKEEWYKTYLQGKIAIKIKPENKNCSVLGCDVIYSTSARPSGRPAQQGAGFLNFSRQDLEKLFMDYFRHIFSFSNYHQKNEGLKLNIQLNQTTTGGTTTMHYKIKRVDNKPIKA